MKTYVSLFLKSLNKRDSSLAIVDGRTIFEVKRIRSILRGYIEWIEGMKVKPRERVALLGERNAESVLFFNALLLSDAVPVLVDRKLPRQQIKKMIGTSKIFSSRGGPGTVQIPKIKDLPTVDDQSKFTFKGATTAQSDLFSVHTSGTTGQPKSITYSNKNISWTVREYARLYRLKELHNVLFALPFHYCFGFIACCVSPLSAGGKVILLPENETRPEQIARIIKTHRVNILVINPYFYTQLGKLDLSTFDFSSLKICDSGGETLPVAVIKKFQSQVNVTITEGYGLAETSSLTHFLVPDKKGRLRLGSVGRPCRGVQCKIVDSKGTELRAGAIGELLVKGPMVVRHYDDPRNNKAAFYGTWFRTGDLFYRDRDDYYYLVGRKKDATSIPNSLHAMVSRVIPALVQLPGIIDLAYKFIDKNVLLVYVVPQSNNLEKRKIIEAEIFRSMPITLKKKVTIKFVASVPRTTSGKVQRHKLTN
jgi:long-chain acyl-CoA synthetase